MSRTGGFPITLLIIGVVCAFLAAMLLLARQTTAGWAGVDRRRTMTTNRAASPGKREHVPRKRRKQPRTPIEATWPAEEPMNPERPLDEVAGASAPEQVRSDELLDALRPAARIQQESRTSVGGGSSSSSSRSLPQGERERAPTREPDLETARLPTPALRGVAAEQLYEIKLWRGYVKCQLLAIPSGWAGELVESRFFRLRAPARPNDQALRALSALLAKLERSGWSVVESGPAWYSRRLERTP